MASKDRLVWSDQAGGRTGEPEAPDPRPGRRARPDRARRPAGQAGRGPGDPADGVARVRREKAGRRGKPVTTISGAPLPEAELRELASELKRRCGSGGSLKHGVIEIQGDHREEVLAALAARNIPAKLAGG